MKYLTFQEEADRLRKATGTDEETVLLREKALVSGLFYWVITIVFGVMCAGVFAATMREIVLLVLRTPFLLVDITLGAGIVATVCALFYVFQKPIEALGDAICDRVPLAILSIISKLFIVALGVVAIPRGWIVWVLLAFGACCLGMTVACYKAVGPQFRPVIGSWTMFYDSRVFESDRVPLFSALASKHDGGISRAPDISDSSNEQVYSRRPLPAPPGITEIVLDAERVDVFKKMRAHLASVRYYHRAMFWLVIVLFLGLTAIGFSKFLGELHSTSDYVKAFGSFGLAGGILWFVRGIMFEHRVSQVSLALFESYVAEVKSVLDEIPQGCDPAESSKLRMDAWKSFRIGLNDLWISERRRTEATR